MFRRVSKSGQTLGNISEKHRETLNVSEFARNHFCFSGSKFCFRNNVSTGGQTFEETSRITNVSTTMFPSLPWALICGVWSTPNCEHSSHMRLSETTAGTG